MSEKKKEANLFLLFCDYIGICMVVNQLTQLEIRSCKPNHLVQTGRMIRQFDNISACLF